MLSLAPLMGIADRQYHQMPPNMPRQPSRLDGVPVVKWLLIVNIVIYFLEMLTNSAPIPPEGFARMHDSFLWNWGYFSFDQVFFHGQIWRLFTFQFLHGDGWHVFANMLGLFFFGHFVERWWGSAKFLVFYLACGVAGALFYSLLLVMPFSFSMDESGTRMIGASAGIYGILIAVAMIAPNLKVFLFFVIPMSMRYFAIGILCFAAFQAFTDGSNAGGEAGHLGGAILGYVLMRYPYLLGFVHDGFTKRKGSFQRRRTKEAKVAREKKIRPRIHINLDDSEVDKILDKVNREGIQSLTEEEREILRRSSGG